MRLAILAATVLVFTAFEISSGSLIPPLPPRSSSLEARYQPVLDFDRDSCYFTAAIALNGTLNPGLPLEGPKSGECRTKERLEMGNVYSRRRCNNGWCAYMYEYYFEKDQRRTGGKGKGGHTHEWENVVVFVKDGKVRRAMPSCHGTYKKHTGKMRFQDDHVRIVYHKDGRKTHCFRTGNYLDEQKVEVYTHWWYLGENLIGWNHWPNSTVDLKQKLLEGFTGKVAPKLWDREDVFTKNLRAAAGKRVKGFDPSYDDPTTHLDDVL